MNAISEVTDMSYERSIEVFKDFSKKHKAISAKALISGVCFTRLQIDILPKILSCLEDHEKVDYTIPFNKLRFDNMNAFADRLRNEIVGEKTVALLGFGHPWNHWTVATGVSDHAIILKDSTHQRRKMFSSLALASNDGVYTKATPLHSRMTIIFKKSDLNT